MRIRKEEAADVPAIRALILAAFAGSGDEPAMVDALRKAEALILSLVAVEEGEIAGHVAFSPVMIDGCEKDWFGMAPVSVAPDRQGIGIGFALVQRGLVMLAEIGASGCVVLGSPAYYGRFGFIADEKLRLPGVPPAAFQALVFGDGAIPHGIAAYHAAFGMN